jgi:hypothetical protein
LAVRLQELAISGVANPAILARILHSDGRSLPKTCRWHGILADLPLPGADSKPVTATSGPPPGCLHQSHAEETNREAPSIVNLGKLAAVSKTSAPSNGTQEVTCSEGVDHGLAEEERSGERSGTLLLPFRAGEWPAAEDLLREGRGRPVGRASRPLASCAA